MESIGKRAHRQCCDRSGRSTASHHRLALAPPPLHSLSDAARSRRAHSGGPTRRSEIFRGRTVGLSSSTHRSHQKPLHVLIGSPLTIYEGGAVARTGSGGATMRTRNAVLALPSRPAEAAVLAGLGLDGASCHGQTHSSCPRAATRLIEPERRGCTVDYEVVPGIGAAGPSGRRCAIDDEVEVRSAGEAKT